MDNRRYQSIVFNILAVVGILLLLVIASKIVKANQFKKYTNKAAGVSVKYPATWSLVEGTPGLVVMFRSPIESDLDYFRENVNIVKQDLRNKNLNLMLYTQKAINQMKIVFRGYIEILESKPVWLAGQSGYKFHYVGRGPQADVKILHLWTIKDDFAYQFTYTALVTEYDKYIKKVEKMINSFEIH